MSRAKHFGATIDRIYGSNVHRVPGYQVFIWNPNRATIQDVVLNQAESPRYDITSHVKKIDFNENIVFENNDDAVSTNCSLTLQYDPDAKPIPISERTLMDGTPLRIYQGDSRVPKGEWVCIFTGVVRGNPSIIVHDRTNAASSGKEVQVLVVDRAEKYLNKVATGRNYIKGDDIGKAAVETAIEFMYLDRREIEIGNQSYAIGHEQSQIVDIEVLKGIYQILQCVGKKPRFNGEGKLVAADTALARVPMRVYKNRDLFVSIVRTQQGGSLYNTVKFLGLDDDLTEVRERKKRLAHGDITTGFFDSFVRETVYFSETPGTQSGGRKARDTTFTHKLHTLGDVGGSIEWTPFLESDGYTCFGGQYKLDTGYAPWIMGALVGSYLGVMTAEAMLLSMGDTEAAGVMQQVGTIGLVAIMITMMSIGRVSWEIYGYPIQNVFQQLCATAQLSTVLSEDIKELEIRNDWIYDQNVLTARAKEHLKRELIKGWTYEILMLDDPLLECDDIFEVMGERYYIISIRKTLMRPTDGLMAVTCWRLQ